jgi:hypothetical protein
MAELVVLILEINSKALSNASDGLLKENDYHGYSLFFEIKNINKNEKNFLHIVDNLVCRMQRERD